MAQWLFRLDLEEGRVLLFIWRPTREPKQDGRGGHLFSFFRMPASPFRISDHTLWRCCARPRRRWPRRSACRWRPTHERRPTRRWVARGMTRWGDPRGVDELAGTATGYATCVCSLYCARLYDACPCGRFCLGVLYRGSDPRDSASGMWVWVCSVCTLYSSKTVACFTLLKYGNTLIIR